jgi:hypothetical protein
MTAIVTNADLSVREAERSAAKPSLSRAGAAAGACAAAATTAIAAVAHASGVSFENAPGKAIPLAGFAQLTLVFTLVGVLLAAGIRRRSANPRSTFTKVTIVLTGLSLVPDLTMGFAAASAVTLMATHLVAAAIVIPTLARRLRPA